MKNITLAFTIVCGIQAGFLFATEQYVTAVIMLAATGINFVAYCNARKEAK